MRPLQRSRTGPSSEDRSPAETERPPEPSPVVDVLALQRSAGNQSVARLLDPVGAQSKWPWGYGPFPDGDPYYQPPEPPELREWEKLEPIRHYFDKGTDFEAYLQLRPLFLGKFGLETDGPDLAVDRALAYYRDKIVPHTFLGKPAIFVHQNMADALLNAEAALGGARIPIESIYGANIRLVRGSTDVMSDHSWGASIDVNGGTSPMTAGLFPGSRRVELIAAITGTDVTQDFEGAPITTKPKTSDEMFQDALRLEEASDKLKAAFADEESLRDAAFEIANARGAPTGGPDELLGLMYAAGTEDRKDIKEWQRQRAAAPAKKRKNMPQEKRLWDWDPVPADDHSDPAPGRQALAAFVFPVDDGTQSLLWDENVVETTVDVLAGMGRIFEDSFDPKGPDGRVGRSAAFPSDATLAVHGFMSVPPELVAALSGSEHGNLKWLGANSGQTKDYMHFDLRERPSFY